ncbi:MAG: LamG-like jellyroll fold domain-containing protein [Phycisphaerae bacterium]
MDRGGSLPPGVIAYWPLDEGTGFTAHDTSGNGNDGQITGAVWAPGVLGSALEFGDTDLVGFVPASFDDSVTNGLTITAWVYWHGPHPSTYSPNSYIFDARTWGGGYGGFIFFIKENGELVLRLIQSGGPSASISSITPIQPDTWTHVAGVFDGTGTMLRLYIDGSPETPMTTTATYRDTVVSAAFGNNRWAPGDGQWAPINGIIDEMYVLDRALSGSEILMLMSTLDCNGNGIDDPCDLDCGTPGGPCDVPGCGQSGDCNANGVPDDCEPDCNGNGIVDECEVPPIGQGPDCNANGVPDVCESDCNGNGIPDECEVPPIGQGPDCNANGVPDVCESDCNGNGIPDDCEVPPIGQGPDCNANGVPDECDIVGGTSYDLNGNGVPDECDPDCNANGIPDDQDISSGWSQDCDGDGIPDDCEVPPIGPGPDCNANGVPDDCESDCNSNGIPDECEVPPIGPGPDCNANGVPDDCESDCNSNGIPDECEVPPIGSAPDCNGNGIPDDCEVPPIGPGLDCNSNGIPDECEVPPIGLAPDCNANGVPDDCEEPLEILLHPLSQTVFEGDAVVLSAFASGPPPLSYQWHKNGVTIPGANAPDYVLNPVNLADDGRYDVVVSCGSNQVTSLPAFLTVLSLRAKWPQPPGEHPGPEGDFYGWNEGSKYDRVQIVSDDWACIGDQPITEIVWWGSYRAMNTSTDPSNWLENAGWLGDFPPTSGPVSFQIAIWSDVPAGVDQPWSHPGTVVAEWVAPIGQLNEHKVGVDYHPTYGADSCFMYHFVIPPGEWFQQAPGTLGVYWISISAQYPCACLIDMNLDGMVSNADIAPFLACLQGSSGPICEYADGDCDGDVDIDDQNLLLCQINSLGDPLVCCPGGGAWPPAYIWGWKTRQPTWNDSAIVIVDPTGPMVGSTFVGGQPVENAEGGWDMAFVLLSNTQPQRQGCCMSPSSCIDDLLPWECVQVHGGVPAGNGRTCAAAPPAVVQNPVDDVTCVDGTAVFTVVADGSAPLSYQWRKDGIEMPGATTASLMIGPCTLLDSGSYDVLITNACGSVTSLSATLTVWPMGTADVNGDGRADGLDIRPFVGEVLIAGTHSQSFCAADMNGDEVVDTMDISLFVGILVGP